MAKGKKKEQPRAIEGVEETLTKTEQFLEKNWKPITYVLAVIAVLVGIVWLINRRMDSRTEEALSQMYVAEDYLDKDSLNLALYGDGNYMGFIDIADEYKMTRAGNMANYSAGISFLWLGQYEDAIDYFERYKKKDRTISIEALGGIGDAYVELGEIDRGIDYYLKAANYSKNSFYSPYYLMKAAQLYDLEGRYGEALDLYEKIKKEFPESTEGRDIDKYISRAKVLQ